MRRRIAAGILFAAAAAGCRDEAVPVAPTPPPAAAPAAAVPTVRTPAGEVPPNSRVARDPDGSPAAPFAGFDYAFPGPLGSTGHYHVRVPDAGAASAVAAGGPGGGALSVRAWRVSSASAAAAAARDAMRPNAASVEVLDPATAGGCGAEAGHSGATGSRRVPVVRVVRARGTRDALAAAGKAAAALPGLEPIFDAELGGGDPGDAWLDLHLVER